MPKPTPSKYLVPLTPTQMKDVQELIAYTEANRKPLRKPRIRKRDPNSTPRPVNCFLVYRREKQAQIAELCIGANHRVISKIVARWWKNIDEHTKSLYVDAAKQVKIDHALKFPDYKYAPKRKQNPPSKEYIKTTTTQPVTPANGFYKKLEENNLAESSTVVPEQQLPPNSMSSFENEMAKQFIDLIYRDQPTQQTMTNNLPILSDPVVDDIMAQHMDSWQMYNNSNLALVPTQMTTDWRPTMNPQEIMTQQQDPVHPLDVISPPNPLDFNVLGYGIDNLFWSLGLPPFLPATSNNMIGMMGTPDMLMENDSPVTVSSSFCPTATFSYSNQTDFVHPDAAVKQWAFISN